MTCHQPTVAALRGAGYRMTPQRAVIAEALHHLGGHVTAEQVADHVRQRLPYMDLSTVYRTLELMCELGLVWASEQGGRRAFELAEEPHHHLKCGDCGAVVTVAASETAALEQHLRAGHGFEADLRHRTFTGRCRACAEAAAAPRATGEVPSSL